MRRVITLLALVGVASLLGVPRAFADTVNFQATGTFSSVYIGQGDPVIQDASTGITTVNLGDPWTLNLTFTKGQFDSTAAVNLAFDGYSFSYNQNSVSPYSPPIIFTTGTSPLLSLEACADPLDCTDSALYMNLYFTDAAGLAGVDDLPTAALLGDGSASPSPFEFLRNFESTGDNTDLQGAITSASATLESANEVPEPPSVWLFATGVLGLGLGLAWRRRQAASA